MKIGRLIHIAEHYEKQHLAISRWSPSLVVKGLLKQIYADFNVSEAWKELASRDANGNRLLEWNKQAARRLKHKLEFHEGAATDVAAEAQQLALNRTPQYSNPAWTSSDSRVTTLTSPVILEYGTQPWPESSAGGASQTRPYSTMVSQPDVEMSNSDSRNI